MGAPYIYDISRLRVKDLHSATYIYVVRRLRGNKLLAFMELGRGGIYLLAGIISSAKKTFCSISRFRRALLGRYTV